MSFECGVPYSNSLLWSDSWFNSEIVFLNNVDLIERQWKASMFHGMLHSFMFPSVRCGHLGSVFVKISTSVWYGLFHILNVLHRKQTLNMTGKIKSQHILFRSFIPTPYELYAFSYMTKLYAYLQHIQPRYYSMMQNLYCVTRWVIYYGPDWDLNLGSLNLLSGSSHPMFSPLTARS